MEGDGTSADDLPGDERKEGDQIARTPSRGLGWGANTGVEGDKNSSENRPEAHRSGKTAAAP